MAAWLLSRVDAIVDDGAFSSLVHQLGVRLWWGVDAASLIWVLDIAVGRGSQYRAVSQDSGV